MKTYKLIDAIPFHLPFDDVADTGDNGADDSKSDDGDEGNAGDNTGDTKPTKKPVAPKIKLDATTQDYVNSLLAEEKRKGQHRNQELIKLLETQKNITGTTAAEKERLELRIQDLQSEYTSKEELSKQSTSKKIKELEAKAAKAEAEAKKWQVLFQNDRVTNSLMHAATTSKAYNPSQVVALLTPKTRLVEVMDDAGNPIPDSWVEKVKIETKDKDGKPIILDLSATEAVKQLSEMEDYGNLFISGATGGLGGGNLPNRNGGGNADTPPKDTAAYMAWRNDRKKKGLPV